MKHPRGYRFITVLGIALSTVLVVFLKISLGNSFGIFDTLGLLLVCCIISGIVGISINKGESLGKHSKYFGFFAVLGAVFVTIFSINLYLTDTTSFNRVVSFVSLGPFIYLYNALMFFLFIGGPVFLIVGIVGIGRQYFKNLRNLFTVLTVILVPLFVFALIVLVSYLIPLQVAF